MSGEGRLPTSMHGSLPGGQTFSNIVTTSSLVVRVTDRACAVHPQWMDRVQVLDLYEALADVIAEWPVEVAPAPVPRLVLSHDPSARECVVLGVPNEKLHDRPCPACRAMSALVDLDPNFGSAADGRPPVDPAETNWALSFTEQEADRNADEARREASLQDDADRCGACAVCYPDWRGMYLCATCGNKRCPHATDCRLPCTCCCHTTGPNHHPACQEKP